jgi:BolA protein
VNPVIQDMKARLASLAPLRLEILDESALHAGHAGARGGGGHFQLVLVSQAFAGQSLIARHRLVYQALGDLMTGPIHALSITALAPEES